MEAGIKLSSLHPSLELFLEKLPELPLTRHDLSTLPEEETLTRAQKCLSETLQEEGNEAWAEHLIRDVAPALNGSSLSPNYYGFVTGGCTPAALFGDMLASIHDQNVQVHLPDQTIATNVEVCALHMLLDLFHLDRETWGMSPTFTTGATASNVLGLAMGREWVLRHKAEKRGSSVLSVGEHGLHAVMEAAGVKKVQVISTMPHSSIAKAASIVGLGRANVVSLSRINEPENFTLEIDLDRLEVEAGKAEVGTILVICAGEVNTGRFATNGYKQMKRLRSICDQHCVWIHVDGAFGLFGRVLSREGEAEFGEIIRGCQGLELADSITGDGHKLLNVPYDCGFYFCRHNGIAEEVFRNGNAAYLATKRSDDDITSPLNIGIENSRRFRALPVYASLLAYGRAGYVDMLRRQIRLARKIVEDLWDSGFYQTLPETSSKAEIVGQTFMVVLFRANDQLHNSDLVRQINSSKKVYISGTTWDGRPAARLAIANWNVDVERDHERFRSVLLDIATRK
jgi:glutamate/tyrosine decarboxylase-like PLP-dependent enzyme